MSEKDKLKSLEIGDIKQVCDLIRRFRIAMSNLLLYPSGSDLLTESIGNVSAILSTILEKYKILILSEVEGALLANAVRVDIEGKDATVGIFTESLDSCNIKSVTFRQGVTIKELHLFLESLAKKRKLKGTGDSITEIFNREKVTHIGLNEKIYAAIGESDLVIERGAELIEKSGGSIDGIMEALRGVTEMVSSIDDERTRDRVKLEIAEKLIATDPKLLVELVKGKPDFEKVVGEPVTLEGKIGFLPTEIKAIVGDITTAYRELVCGDTKGLSSLRAVLDRILSLTKDRIPSLELYNELIKVTDVLETPLEVHPEVEGETIQDQLENLINKDTLSLISEEATESMKKLFENLVSEDELALAAKLVERLAQNFGAAISDIRLKTALAFKKLYPKIEALKDPNIVHSLDDKLIDVENKESHRDTYSEIALILHCAANRYLKEGNHQKSLEIIQLFRKHTYTGGEELSWRRKLAEEVMHKFTESELTRLLLDEFCSLDKMKQKEASSVLMELGNFATTPLIKRLKETADIETRKDIAFLLEKIGETAITRLVEELDIEKRAEPCLRIIELLDKIGNKELIVEQLRETLSNPEFQVRRAALIKLNQIGTDRAKQIILDAAINDPSPTIRQLSIGFLGEFRYTPAVEPLTELISLRHTSLGKMGEAIQEEACIALGKIGDLKAIPSLRLAARPPMSFRSAKPDRVRVAAVQALIKLGDKEVSKFVKDPNPLIQKIVKEAQ